MLFKNWSAKVIHDPLKTNSIWKTGSKKPPRKKIKKFSGRFELKEGHCPEQITPYCPTTYMLQNTRFLP
jgi:hypothetical protein